MTAQPDAPPQITALSHAKNIALAFLLEAHDYALDANRPVWEYAVPLENLRDEGVTDSLLLWLYHKGYVE